MTVLLDGELLDDSHGAELGDTAHVVASEIDQHQMLGVLFGVGEQLVGQLLVFLGSRAPADRTGERADGDDVVAQPDQDLGRGAHDLEAAIVEEDQDW